MRLKLARNLASRPHGLSHLHTLSLVVYTGRGEIVLQSHSRGRGFNSLRLHLSFRALSPFLVITRIPVKKFRPSMTYRANRLVNSTAREWAKRGLRDEWNARRQSPTRAGNRVTSDDESKREGSNQFPRVEV